jgi:hypothetical protein
VNANDGRIAKISVAKTGGDLQEFAPNAPDAGPAPPAGNFDVVLEMEAGGNVGGRYHLFVSCYDLTAGSSSPAMAPPVGPLNGPGEFAQGPWFNGGATSDWQFDQTVTITVPGGVQGHVFRYLAALVADNHQIIDIKESALFVLV